jgi:hypothetical protein
MRPAHDGPLDEADPLNRIAAPEAPLPRTPSPEAAAPSPMLTPHPPAFPPPAPSAPAPSNDAAPAIHVSIGRVVVRAVTPPAPPRRKATTPPNVMTLDDYLSRRKARGRS